ncbi:hypothetical protein HMPREF8571_0328 [Streptococcus mitis ATCC 6249]|uniref:Uncharacterized protein n=1 Tax=Streptococcus mitis ATCC 6249 TaxID=864567 RepID=E0PP61_STRMT|nr:hypothetical protein HMPREF8571_0328 [Streptococcus mitis ATCC 6249]
MQEVVTTIGYTATQHASVSYFCFEFESLYILDLSIKMLVKNFPNYINKNWKAGLGRSLHCFSALVETGKLNVLFVIGTVFSEKRELIVNGKIYPMRKECYFILLREVASLGS